MGKSTNVFRIPEELRKAATYGCVSLILGEAFVLHAPSFASGSAPYTDTLAEYSTAANYPREYEHSHGEREDYTFNGWNNCSQSASNYASGAMFPRDVAPGCSSVPPTLLESTSYR